MAADQQDNAVIVALLQQINSKVDGVNVKVDSMADKVDSVSTRLAIVESQKIEQKVAELTNKTYDNANRITAIESTGGGKDKVMAGVISFFIAVISIFLAKMLSFIK